MDMTVLFSALMGALVLLITVLMAYGMVTCWQAGSRITPFVLAIFDIGMIVAYVITVIGVFA